MKSLLTLILVGCATVVFAQDTIGYRVNPAKPKNAVQHKPLDPDLINEVSKTYSIKKHGFMKGAKFNTGLLEPLFAPDELENKSLLIVFWKGDCTDCLNNMAKLNPQFRALMRQKNTVLVSITPDNKNNALEAQRYTPMEHTDMISNGKTIVDRIGISNYPSFILTDANHRIKFALTGNDAQMYSLIRHHLIESTTGNKATLSP